MYDCVLYITSDVSEAKADPRIDTTKRSTTYTWSYKEPSFNPGASYSLGGQIRGYLSGLGQLYNIEVCDFGPAVSIRVTYNNPRTCKSASSTYLLVFNSKGGDGHLYTSSARSRTVSDFGQAASYVRSMAQALQNKTT
jgi:hypothetical protein